MRNSVPVERKCNLKTSDNENTSLSMFIALSVHICLLEIEEREERRLLHISEYYTRLMQRCGVSLSESLS